MALVELLVSVLAARAQEYWAAPESKRALSELARVAALAAKAEAARAQQAVSLAAWWSANTVWVVAKSARHHPEGLAWAKVAEVMVAGCCRTRSS